MLGAIAGDIIGSPYEAGALKTTGFPLFSADSTFTDDTVLSVAVADALLSGGNYVDTFHDYFARYPDAGYGGAFFEWARSRSRRPYNSFGNGSAMRVSPVGWAFDTLPEVLAEAGVCATVTHSHPEGVKGAQATAGAVFLARTGHAKEAVLEWAAATFGYRLTDPLDAIRPAYDFDVTCQGTVPVALRAFLEGRDWEECVRLAISMGGDSDTLACITGGMAEAFYGGLPPNVEEPVRTLLELTAPDLLEVVDAFADAYMR